MNPSLPQARTPDAPSEPRPRLAELWYCTPGWRAEKVKTGAYPELLAEMRKLNEDGHDYWIKES